ncbi:hypothetical protein [Eubacterium limosum]|uniref:hypothetical protein n=1 Tax=Eubacterium limosum TaxID=1736 RepID=UPI0037219151
MKLNKLNDTSEHMEKLTFVFCLVLLTVFIVIGFSLLTSMEKTESEIKSVQNKITAIESSGDENKTLEQTQLNFIENEMVRHQDFIETQRQHLMWLVSLIGAIGIFLIGFFGFRTRAEIQNTIAKQELDISESGINHYIGGNENRQYLETAIQRERKAQNAKILFIETEYRKLMLDGTKIYFNEKVESYLQAYNFLKFLPTKDKNPHEWTINYEDFMEMTSDKTLQLKIENPTKNYETDIKSKLDGYDLVIYEIPNRRIEGKVTGDYDEVLEKIMEVDHKLYKAIYDHCKKEEIYCIVYTRNGHIKSLEDSFYTSIANFNINIIQTATTVLNSMICLKN